MSNVDTILPGIQEHGIWDDGASCYVAEVVRRETLIVTRELIRTAPGNENAISVLGFFESRGERKRAGLTVMAA